MGLDLAANNSAVSDFNPRVSRELARIARDAIEKLAHNVPAAKHEVNREGARKTDEGKRGVPCCRVN